MKLTSQNVYICAPSTALNETRFPKKPTKKLLGKLAAIVIWCRIVMLGSIERHRMMFSWVFCLFIQKDFSGKRKTPKAKMVRKFVQPQVQFLF
jgi:hypothetical protein